MSKRIKLEGQKFGKLLVLEYVGGSKYRCKCDCGTIKEIRGHDLRSGAVKSCGCLYKQNRPVKYESLVGKKFGKLTIIEKSSCKKYGQNWWVCLCDCGDKVIVRTSYLISGHTKSCGKCNKFSIHNMSNSSEYNIWKMMLQRCYNSKATSYYHYGGRGIKVCKRWHKFENFYRDMGPRPSLNYTIDRIDNNGNYEPKNCRWATRTEQMYNTRRNRLITYNGKTKPLKLWCSLLNVKYKTVESRLRRGYTFKQIIEDIANE